MEQVPVGNDGQEALQRRYNDLLDISVAGMYRMFLDGRIIECNNAMARMLGHADAAAFMEQGVLRIHRTEEERRDLLDALGREGRIMGHRTRLHHRSGRIVDALENLRLEEHPGKPPIIHGSVVDMTAFLRTELEQRALVHSYRDLVENVRDGLLVVVDDRVVYANPAADKLMGRRTIGVPMVELLPGEQGKDLSACSATEPFSMRIGDRELMFRVVSGIHGGVPSYQITLQDQSTRQELLRERSRVRMVEEINQVLRQEIEQHRRTQEALRLSRRFARSLIDSSLDMIMAADPEGRITEYNPAAVLRFGWEPEEVMGRDSTMLYADDAEYERVQRELDMHGMFAGEIRNITRSGEVFTSFLAASRLFDEDGGLLGVMGVSRDITRMKKDQEALRTSEERYRDLFENATDLIQSVDPEGRFQYVNAAWRRALGYSEEKVKGLHLKDVVHPDHLKTYMARLRQVMRGEEVGMVRTVFVGRDGQEVFVEGTTNLRRVDGRAVATRSIFRDITHEQLAKQQVREHEAKLRALFESSDHMFWTVDPGIRLTSYNRGYAAMVQRLYGVEPELNADPQRPRDRFADPRQQALWDARYTEAFSGRTTRFETDRTDTQGRRVCNEIFLSPVFGPGGQVLEVFGVGHEITEQKEAEDRVREQGARLEAIFESSANMMIWTLDTELRITSCNERFKRSVKADFGADMGVGDVFIEDDADRAAGRNAERYLGFYKAALKGKPQQFEAELSDRHGNTIWVQNFLNPIMVDGRVQEISCLGYHITDRKEAQMTLERNLHEKEVLLKEVHHRVKNNLQIVSSIFSLQSAHVGEDKRMQDLLRDSRDRIRSMSFIHESLYQNKDFSSVDLGDYMEGLGRNLMMSYGLNGKVRLETDLQRVDLVLDQAIPCGLILNELVSNALKHAFPDDREGTIRMRLWQENEHVMISLKDDGVGTPPAFDPLRDANLGLELVHTLVEQLEGTLSMDTREGVAYLLTFERIK